MGDVFNMGNNAPPPIPGGYGNPTGSNNPGMKNNQPGKSPLSNTAFPTYPVFGPVTSPSSGGPSANSGIFGSSDFSHISSALPGDYTKHGVELLKQLESTYGKGTGNILDLIFSKGLFNPQVAAAFLNAMQPGINRGQADILGAFGDAGSRFSSSAALGLGDYMSQVNLNQNQVLAQLFEQSQAQELGLLQNILPTIHDEEANKGGGFWDSLIGGLEIAGGVAGEFFAPGNPLSTAAITGGIGTLGAGLGGGGGSSSSSATGNLQALIKQALGTMNGSNNNGSTGFTFPQGTVHDLFPNTGVNDTVQSSSAAEGLGGYNPFSTSGDNGKSNQLLDMLIASGMISPDQLMNMSSGGMN